MTVDFVHDTLPPPSPTKTRTQRAPRAPSKLFIGKKDAAKGRPGDVVVGFFRKPIDPSEVRGYETYGHYVPGSVWKACESCTTQSIYGDHCPYVQGYIERAMAQGKTRQDAWREAKATKNVYFPFFGSKAPLDKPDQKRELGFCALELPKAAAESVHSKGHMMRDNCASCGGDNAIKHEKWVNASDPTEELSWTDEDRRNGVLPMSPKTKERVDATEVISCRDCKEPVRASITSMQVKIWRSFGEKSKYEFEFNPLKKPTKEVLEAEQVPMKDIVEFAESFAVVLQDTPVPEPKSVSTEDIPF